MAKMNWPEIPDRQLVELCLEGDENAWAEFLRRFRPLVVGVAAKTIPLRLKPTPDGLEDSWQEALCKILANECRALRELEWRHDGSLRGLLKITASTVAQDYIRKQRAKRRDVSREEQLDEHFHDVADVKSAEEAQSRILLQELSRCLEKQMRAEPNHARDIAMFLLFYGFRITASDLARVHKVGTKTVENTVARLGRIARKHCL